MNRSSRYLGGLVGGLVGGVVFGVMLMVMGMMPTIAALVGSSSVTIGWIVHLAVSAVLGLVFAWWFGTLAEDTGTATGYGLVHGLIWWIILPLIATPLIQGTGVQLMNALSQTNLLLLLGYLIYGAVLGLVFAATALSTTTTVRRDQVHRPV